MNTYHKIQTVYKRDPENNYKTLLEGEFSLPEFEYLANNEWCFTEKVDGCLHYTNQIYTDKGLLMIGKIVENKLPVKVLSYNIQKEVVEYKEIEHYHKEKRQRDFLCISVKSKNKGNRPKHIVCTDNHSFFSDNKWIQAKDLVKGQLVSHLSEKLPEEIRQIILGTLLGDSSIYSPSKTTRGFNFIHSISQSSYFDYKKMLLGKIFSENKGGRGGFPGSKKNRRGNSIVNNAISNLIINYCEEDNKKQVSKEWANELSPMGIAFWYMDDGSADFNNRQRARVRFATNAFNNNEVKLLQNMFKTKYNIDSKTFNYKGNTLCLTADGSEKLFSIIFPYICNSMKYKLPKKYRKYFCILDKSFDTYLDIVDTEVLSISKKMPKRAIGQQTFQYDLSVKDNSDYFTNSILVHNTNVRIKFDGILKFAGKTDKANLHPDLIQRLHDIFDLQLGLFKETFIPPEGKPLAVCLYGEGYGTGIQKGGCYRQDKGFLLFDVKVGNWWLQRKDVIDIALKFGIEVAPIIGFGTLEKMVEMTRVGFKSQWGDFIAEGIVARPRTELFARNGKRIITKIKHKDFDTIK